MAENNTIAPALPEVVKNIENDAKDQNTNDEGDTSQSNETELTDKGETSQSNETQPTDSTKENTEVTETGEKLSKNQLRKRKRKEYLADKREKRKAQEKEAKRIKAIAQGRDLDAERKEQLERTKSGEGRQRRDALQMERMKTVTTSFGVCVDCSFEDEMTPGEVKSLASQIRYTYAVNKRSKNPCQLYVSSLKGVTFDIMNKVTGFPEQWTRWAFKHGPGDVLDMIPDKSKLVYLTSDSENELEHLDDSKVYIIGGIVDRNRLKRAAINKAESLGVTTGRLPISSFLKLCTTKVLTCNHVFEILLKYRENGNDWKKAMLDVLPQRKNAQEQPQDNLNDKVETTKVDS